MPAVMGRLAPLFFCSWDGERQWLPVPIALEFEPAWWCWGTVHRMPDSEGDAARGTRSSPLKSRQAMKRCSCCSEIKLLSQFSTNRTKADGKQTYCLKCNRAARQRSRARNRDRDLAYNQEWHRKHNQDPRKVKARRAVSHALARRLLGRKACEVCGEIRVDAHHDDYDKPLEVRWLCRRHHMEAHYVVAA